jgi:hypothetical protein
MYLSILSTDIMSASTWTEVATNSSSLPVNAMLLKTAKPDRLPAA